MMVDIYAKILSFMIMCVLYFCQIHQYSIVNTHVSAYFCINHNKNKDNDFYCNSNELPNHLSYQQHMMELYFPTVFERRSIFT